MSSTPHTPFRRRVAVIVATLLVAAGSTALAQDSDLTRFAEQLAALRADVEALSADVETAKDDQRARLRSLQTQKTDLDMQTQREDRRIKQLEAKMAEQKQEVAQESEVVDALKPALLESIENLRGSIRGGLPFKRGERLAELDKLEGQVKGGVISPQNGANRLWQLTEDEFRLSKENGIYRQTINLGGEEMLVDVARVGMVAMYFRTDDGRYGYVRRVGSDWNYEQVADEEDREKVQRLFDDFKKQIRVGFFELPNALPKEAK
jgi:predicted RNase H-like nuclease (RuvC/YqgF family)